MKNTSCLIVLSLLLTMFLDGCSSSKEKPVIAQRVANKYAQDDYSVILHDMDYDLDKKSGLHKYKILYTSETVDGKDTLVAKTTSWYRVNNEYFDKHVNDLGMSIHRKKGSDEEFNTIPPGFNNYIGETAYGEWTSETKEQEEHKTSGVSGGWTEEETASASTLADTTHRRRWRFFPRYYYMGSLFNTHQTPATHGNWNSYNSNYKNGNTNFYGDTDANGRRRYGTASAYAAAANPKSRWTGKSSHFKAIARQRVRNAVMVSRNANRYGGSSGGLRSKGGGFGK